MDPFNPDIVRFVFGVPALIVGLVLILRYKLKKKELEMRATDPALGAEIDALRDDLDDTRAQLAHLQERIEFAERLLASGRASQEERSE